MKWISVKDRLPDVNERVLWCHSDGYMSVFHIGDEHYVNFGSSPTGVDWPLYWMPLPDPPEDD